MIESDLMAGIFVLLWLLVGITVDPWKAIGGASFGLGLYLIGRRSRVTA